MNNTDNKITLKGNGHWIPVISGHDLTDSELKEFDYHDDPLNDFIGFKYKGDTFDLTQVMRYNETINGIQFHGVINFTVWSGLLIQLSDDGDGLRVYYYYS